MVIECSDLTSIQFDISMGKLQGCELAHWGELRLFDGLRLAELVVQAIDREYSGLAGFDQQNTNQLSA